jgi:hypothetical protein
MKYRTLIYYTETDKALMWDRWQKGDSFFSRSHLFVNWWHPATQAQTCHFCCAIVGV